MVTLYDAFLCKLQTYLEVGQSITGYDNLYSKLIEKQVLFDLFMNGGGKELKDCTYDLCADSKELLELIIQTIRVTNGEPSELWFAIMYGGLLKGGVVGDTGIVSDIDVDGHGVSLKNYGKTSTSIDFGTLSPTASKIFYRILRLFMVISNKDVNATCTRTDLNRLLCWFDDQDNITDLEKFIEVCKDSDINILCNMLSEIERILDGESIDQLTRKFVEVVNDMIADKLNKVSWWAIILNKSQIHIHSSKTLISKFNSGGNRLSEMISNFKGGHLFVKRSSIDSIILNK